MLKIIICLRLPDKCGFVTKNGTPPISGLGEQVAHTMAEIYSNVSVKKRQSYLSRYKSMNKRVEIYLSPFHADQLLRKDL